MVSEVHAELQLRTFKIRLSHFATLSQIWIWILNYLLMQNRICIKKIYIKWGSGSKNYEEIIIVPILFSGPDLAPFKLIISDPTGS